MKSVKFAIIGAGSVCFCPATVADILSSKRFAACDITIYLMDILDEALRVSEAFCRDGIKAIGRDVKLYASTDLEAALDGADFVISAIEVERFHYWSMDFHIPRRYGFRQIFGENGGPGGMFHFLRNLPPLLHIAHTMERLCPNAWLLNYSNPEAKLVDGVSKLTNVNVVGLCHGEQMGIDQLALFMDMPREDIEADAVGLNHFGWFTGIRHKRTGEDLYPKLKAMERQGDWLAHWDEFALSRLMLRTYGLWPYPGANHCGEYIAWSDELLASTKIQYFFDPAHEHPWDTRNAPEFIYSFSSNPTARALYAKDKHNVGDASFHAAFTLRDGELPTSHEYGVPIAEAIYFDESTRIGAVNMPNKGYAPNLLSDMCIELPAVVDGGGIHPQPTAALPTAIAAMINTQGAICNLLIEAYTEQSRHKLLQALLLDPTVSNYNNAVALINEMCERQREILPRMTW